MNPALVQSLREYFTGMPDVAAVYVFGSVAAGRERPESDVDVAVLESGTGDRKGRLDMRLRLIADLEARLGREVDVLLLRDTDPVLTDQVLRAGRLVVEGRPAEHVAWKAVSIQRSLDFQFCRRRLERGLVKAIRREYGPSAGPAA